MKAPHPSPRERVLQAIREERRRQDERWGSPNTNPLPVWQLVLSEEVGEVARAVLQGDRYGLREELVQVAAAVVAWLEQLERETAR